jgi:sugar phosphate isomerase/epimerase
MPGRRKFRFMPPGDGQIDQVAVVKALREVGFDGVLSLELGHGVPQPESAARKNVAFTRGIVGEE